MKPIILNQPPFSGAFSGAFGGALSQKAGFNPTKVAGLVLWLDAREGIILNGSDVSNWADQSDNANNAAQTTPSKQPVFNATGFNGFPSVDFVATNSENFDIADSSSLDLNGSFTAYCACNPDLAADLTIFSKNADAGYRWFWEARAADVGLRLVLTGTSGGNDSASPGAITVNEPSIAEVVFDVSGAKRVTFTNKGVSMGVVNHALTDIVTNNNIMTIGFTVALIDFFDGDMNQLLIYNRALTTAERNIVGNFIARQSNLVWTNAPILPSEIAGLVLWLDAEVGITVMGAGVSAWLDQSGEGNNAAQTTDADRPAFNATGIGSKPSLTFDSSNTEDMDIADANSLDLTGDFTMYCVCKPASFANTTILNKGSTDYRWRLTVEASEGNQDLLTNPGSIALTSDEEQILANEEVILEISHKAGGGTALCKFTKSGVSMGFDFPTGATIDTSTAQIFLGSAAGSNYFNGEVAQVLQYDRLITTGERNLVGNYLADRYGLIWTNVEDVEFDPTLLSGLVVWWDADNGVSSDGEGVTSWLDQSANSNDAANVVNTTKPVFNPTGINGNPSLTFDGANTRLDAPSSTSLNFDSSFTVYILNKVTDLDGFRTMFAKTTNAFRFLYNQSDGRAFSIVSSSQRLSTNGTAVDLEHILEIHYQLTVGGAINFTSNGTPLGAAATSAISTITRDTQPFIIGQFGTPDSQVFEGEIGQIVIYNRLLTTPERNIVGNYLADRYGLTWTEIV